MIEKAFSILLIWLLLLCSFHFVLILHFWVAWLLAIKFSLWYFFFYREAHNQQYCSKGIQLFLSFNFLSGFFLLAFLISFILTEQNTLMVLKLTLKTSNGREEEKINWSVIYINVRYLFLFVLQLQTL